VFLREAHCANCDKRGLTLDLSSKEGVVLMCLAEALLRIPDDDTRDRMIRDKLADADWESLRPKKKG